MLLSIIFLIKNIINDIILLEVFMDKFIKNILKKLESNGYQAF